MSFWKTFTLRVFFPFCLSLFIFPKITKAQEQRITDRNAIGWLCFFGTWHLDKKISLHAEYQFRRTQWLEAPQQHLLRFGVNYRRNEAITWHAGYGFIKTYPYGEYPIASSGVPFPEHRLYEQLLLRQTSGKSRFLHRFRLEQRWLGKPDPNDAEKIESWTYLNRIRYLVRFQYPLQMIMPSGKLYAAAYDEVFIGFGENIGANVFDQNRLGLLMGYSFNEMISIEGGFLSQILQQGGRINGQPVYQHNSGIQFSALLNINPQ